MSDPIWKERLLVRMVSDVFDPGYYTARDTFLEGICQRLREIANEDLAALKLDIDAEHLEMISKEYPRAINTKDYIEFGGCSIPLEGFGPILMMHSGRHLINEGSEIYVECKDDFHKFFDAGEYRDVVCGVIQKILDNLSWNQLHHQFPEIRPYLEDESKKFDDDIFNAFLKKFTGSETV